MKLSVLICTYNRPDMLRSCLSSLTEHSETRPDQIIVVNGGDEMTDRLVENFREVHCTELVLVKTINRNLAASRNVGLPLCTGDIIAMTDDDAEVFPDWAGQMKRLHAEHPEAGAIGGPVIGANPKALISRLADRVTFSTYVGPRTVRTLPGVNVSYKREATERVGMQDETLFRGEDVDYNWRVQKLGYTIYYDPSVRVLHQHRPTLRAFLNQHYMYGRAYYLVRRKWPEMYCVYPHSLKSVKDFLKGVNFIAAIFYEPAIAALQMESMTDKLLAYPFLLANQIAWRGGMVSEKLSWHPS